MADILLVDDDQDMTGMLKTVLERRGHQVITASNGVEALELFPDDGLHLVITDIQMPELDGFELIPALLARVPGQRIIAMSGVDQWNPKDNLHVARDLGAVSCVEKPFDIDVFYEHVQEVVG